MTVALADHYIASPGHGGDHVTRLDRQDLIAVSVEQQQRFATQSRRHFATR